MSQYCPVNFEQVEANVARFSALFVSILIVSYLVTGSIYLLVFMLADFGVKLFINKKFSPINQISMLLKKVLVLKNKFTDGGAKRLAAYFGLIFTALLIVLHFVDIWLLTLVVAGIFLSCALLEFIFEYCLGCKIYFIIKKIFPSFMS